MVDLGNGRTGHLRWDIAESVLKAGFLPDTLSTDWTPEARTIQVFDLPNVMSKFLMLGLTLDQVVAFTTVNAARAPTPPMSGTPDSLSSSPLTAILPMISPNASVTIAM